MPPNPFARISEIRNTKNPRISEIFFNATEDEIIEALVTMGYVRRTAEKEAHQFMEYKESLTSSQDWDEDEEAPPETPPEYEGFGASVQRIKQQQETKGE
jgi:hypothetical protein